MKRFQTLLLLLLGFIQTHAQDALNMTKLSGWRDADHEVFYNDVWGYATKGREYAILGSSKGTHFIDVTEPTRPRHIAFEPGKTTKVTWRDFKTYQHYAYGVADGADNSLQIFDLSNLPFSVKKVYDSNEFTESAHNCFIDNGKLYLISNTKEGVQTGLVALSLENPEKPAYLGKLNSSVFFRQHDVYVKNDTAYCSSTWEGLSIFEIKDINNPTLISSITSYPGKGYNHSGWTTSDNRTLVFADESPLGMPLKLYDISDVYDPAFHSTFQSNPGATPHNPYIIGNHVVISYYHDGVQVFDISDPKNPQRAGYYDTYPDNDLQPATEKYANYRGCWGVYPFLPSGNILASDITYGLFVLTPPYEPKPVPAEAPLQVYPNPAEGAFKIDLPAGFRVEDVQVYDLTGRRVAYTWQQLGLRTYQLRLDVAAGMYLLRAPNGKKVLHGKVVLQ